MRYNLTPNKPRPLATVHVGATPNTDVRWRGLMRKPLRDLCVDRVLVLTYQRKARNPNPVRNP